VTASRLLTLKDKGTRVQVDYHFVCFVPVDGCLYELDGRKDTPINHGATTADSFLADAAKVIKEQFMVRLAAVEVALYHGFIKRMGESCGIGL
jgi:hypothetical protein